MKLVHISDIHLTGDGRPIWGVNTLEHFYRAIQKIKSLDDIDGIIVSGDLSNDGSRCSYEYLDRAFAKIGIPTFCCPGNHDNLDVFYHGYKPLFYKTCETFKLGEWTFIMLNSAVTGMSRGSFDHEALSKLISINCAPIAIVLHHPPLEQEGWLNRKLLDNRRELNDMIIRANNVKLVLFGHTHFHTDSIVKGVVYSSASSTGFAFDPHLPKFEIAHGKEGFSLITLYGTNIKIENVLI